MADGPPSEAKEGGIITHLDHAGTSDRKAGAVSRRSPEWVIGIITRPGRSDSRQGENDATISSVDEGYI